MKEKFKFLIQGAKGAKQPPPPRLAVEDPEGVNTTAFPRDIAGIPDPGAVSLTKIEVLDLLGEGEIEGLITGEYSYVGTLGNVGYTSSTFSGYDNAPGTTVKWLRSVYWNEVPVVNSENKLNFQSVNAAFTSGLPNGSTLGQLKTELTTSRAIGERLRYGSDFAKIYRILNKDCKAIDVNIRIGQLSQTNTTREEYGDTEETTVYYNVKYKPLFSTVGKTSQYSAPITETITGKISYGYIRTTRISFVSSTNDFITDNDFLGWEIKIERTTPDSINTTVRNQTSIDSITEVFGDIFTYPNSAIVATKFSAEYFSQIPARAYDTKLLKVLIPTNYDPINKTYSPEPWDGTFTTDKRWTDNPAWCYYDLLTNQRYGLGKYIGSSLVDKWTLYDIAKYCDTLVDDGFGGIEPRFSCNLIITSKEAAYKVVNDLASVFRGMTYYAAGTIYATQDSQKTKPYIWEFTNANIENGDFNYSSSSKRVRNTVAIVRYNDKFNFYKPAVEYVEDREGIKKYGIREVELTAFGCTSRGQALRVGRWVLLTETLETETISFTAGFEGAILRPGDVFSTFDFHRKARRFGGRTYSLQITGQNMATLDSRITGLTSDNQYTFSLLTPTYNYDPTLVNLVDTSNTSKIRNSHIQQLNFSGSKVVDITGADSGVRSQIEFGTTFNTGSYYVTGNLIWLVEGSGNTTDTLYNQIEYYRTIQIAEQEGFKFNIVGLQYVDSKYQSIESGLAFDQPGSNDVPIGPNVLNLKQREITSNLKIIDYDFSIANNTNIGTYLVYAKNGVFGANDLNGNDYLINILPETLKTGSYIPASDGTYYFRVYSNSKVGTKSTTYAANNIQILGVNVLKDVTISSLMLDTQTGVNEPGTRATGEYLMASPLFKWQAGLAQSLLVPSSLSYRISFREPSLDNHPSSNIYGTPATGVNPSSFSNLKYVYEFETNLNSADINGKNGPFREYDVVVEAHDANGNSSAGGHFDESTDSIYDNYKGYDILYVNNPRISGLTLTEGAYNGTDPYFTEQWITPDGDIKIYVSGSTSDDLEGAYVYTSINNFNKSEALKIIPTSKNIVSYQIPDLTNPLIAPAKYTGVNLAYIAVSFYDTFDKALLDKGRVIEKDLNFSNVVKIEKRGLNTATNTDYAFSFRSWIELKINNNFNGFEDWSDTQYGIKAVNFIGLQYEPINVSNYIIAVGNKYEIVFDTSLSQNNYTVVIFVDDEEFLAASLSVGSTTRYKDIYISQKNNDKFNIVLPFFTNPNPSTTYTTKIFLGVLWNG